ncbi:hypothetical protein SAMN02745196_02346 [Clostridium collagenovorans DSM 3089]|uniref:Phage transcriptional activator, RinA family n=1 Tax=Clostridium collagenovorans DSM 3089 TaxID=1121306 RepID=A0A1M5XNQ3_9CLOT|nr:hypothetical protein [Clostridium collagenovorans]SHI01457.1 hypothetical protein SAMN02745196_02346 [Clostridium collagenovorans DSM 3089]
MDKVLKETENLLYGYKDFETKLKIIDLEIEKVKSNYNGVSAVRIEEASSKTNKVNSGVENEILKKEEAILKLQEMKKEIEYTRRKVDISFSNLTDEEQMLVNLRYFSRPKKTWIEIGNTMGIDKDYCCKLRKNIVYRIGNLVNSI